MVRGGHFTVARSRQPKIISKGMEKSSFLNFSVCYIKNVQALFHVLSMLAFKIFLKLVSKLFFQQRTVFSGLVFTLKKTVLFAHGHIDNPSQNNIEDYS
jgi:hypothetical protein